MRRLFAIFGAILILLPVAARSAPLTDLSASPYRDAIQELTDRGVVQGYEDGTFRPDAPVNRAEFLKILLDTRFPEALPPDDLRCFLDLEVQTPQWYAQPVCLARALGIVSGYPDGWFRPGKPVSLAEALKMAFRTFSTPLSSGSGLWYETYLLTARMLNILLPLLKKPAHLLTRGEMASLTVTLLRETEEAARHPPSGHPAVCGNGARENPEQCDDGNTLDSDGCSSICIIVPEPVRRAFLQIDQRTTGTLTTIAQGQQGLPLLKFTALAGRQDVLLSSLRFAPSIGSLAFGQHYRLAMDRDGDGKYEQIVQADGRVDTGTLTFSGFTGGGVLLQKGLTVPFMVTADLAGSLGPVTIGLEFATTLPDYVEAQGAEDGLALTGIETDNACTADTCFIRVNTEASTDVNISEHGNLFVTADTVPVRSHLLLGGTVSDALLRLKLRAGGEDTDLHTIRIDGVSSSVDALLLFIVPPGQGFDPGKSPPVAQATNGQCPTEPKTRFCVNLSLRTILVTPQQEVTLVIAAKMKTKALGAVSGENMRLSLSPTVIPSSVAIEARGTSSNQTLLQNNGDEREDGEIFIGAALPGPNRQIIGPMHDTALATIADIVNSGSAEELFIPSGQRNIGAFKFIATPHDNSFHGTNDVIIRTLQFRVSAQNVQMDPLGFRLRASDAGTTMPCTATETTGTFTVTCSHVDEQEVQSAVWQGSSLAYFLDANVTNTEIVPGPSTLFVTLPILGDRTQENSVLWSDGVTDFSWVDIGKTSVDSTIYRQK
ncbi:MAG: S-layer homology domain-containing protein [Candidatus Peribacteraceae bacterium]